MESERAVIMQSDEADGERPASQPLSYEGAAWEMMRLARANPGTIHWIRPASEHSAS